jgi:hypothetical protein
MTYPLYPGYPSPSPHYPPYQVPAAPIVITQPQAAQTRRDARDVAELGAHTIGRTVGLASILLGAGVAIWLVVSAGSIGATPGDKAVAILVAVGLALAVVGLPLVHATTSRNYPHEARLVLVAWCIAAGVAAIGVIYAATLSGPPKSRIESARVIEQRERYGISEAMWRHSGRCTAPENTWQAERCDRYSRATKSWFDSRPATTGGTVILALLGLVAVAGCGWIARFAMLGIAEAVRLPNSEASPSTGGAAAGMMPDAAGAILTPQAVFDSWFNGRIVYDPAGRLSASAAYEDYAQTCRMNAQPPLSSKKFGDLLTSRASASGGRIGKIKSGGQFYTGIRFTAESDPIDVEFEPATDGLAGTPHRA